MINALVAAIAIGATTQAPPPKSPSVVEMVKDVAALLSRHHPEPAELRADADRLAQQYGDKIKSIKREVGFLCDMAKQKAEEFGLQQKLNLAMELWRVRASLDLLMLADPATVKQLTGLDLPDLRDLRLRFNKAQLVLTSALPGF